MRTLIGVVVVALFVAACAETSVTKAPEFVDQETLKEIVVSGRECEGKVKGPKGLATVYRDGKMELAEKVKEKDVIRALLADALRPLGFDACTGKWLEKIRVPKPVVP